LLGKIDFFLLLGAISGSSALAKSQKETILPNFARKVVEKQ